MGRKATVWKNLPIGMRARPRGRKVFYYLDQGGKPRKEVPLGSDYILALQQYVRLVQNVIPAQVVTFTQLAQRYEAEIIPTKAPRTQKGNELELKPLLSFFSEAPLSEVKPVHIAQYRDWRVAEIRKRLLRLKRSVTPQAGYVSSNRELALFSHIWNKGREWGYTDRPNPCLGVSKHRERGREIYVDDATYQSIWQCADEPLRDAMDLAWLTGQRPGDVLRLCEADIKEGAVWMTQGKTGTKLRISITGKLAQVLERIQQRKLVQPQRSSALVCNESGISLTHEALRSRFDRARAKAGLDKQAFQFRDLRAKAATETEQGNGMEAAKKQLGHTSDTMTKRYVRNRMGHLVKPTR